MRPVAILWGSMARSAPRSKGRVDVRQVRPSSQMARRTNYLVSGCRAQLTIAENWDSCLFIANFYPAISTLSIG